MVSMVDKYLATEMFEFNALSQSLDSIALFNAMADGLVIYANARAFKAKADKAKKFGLKAKDYHPCTAAVAMGACLQNVS